MTYRKPSWQGLALTAVVASAASLLLAFSRPVEVSVDGQRLVSDVPPVTTVSNRVYVPLRALADALGAQTKAKGKNVVVTRGNRSLRLKVGNTHASLNGEPVTFKHAPFRVRGRVMIGMKAFARVFGVRVSYDRKTARVDVDTTGVSDTASAQ